MHHGQGTVDPTVDSKFPLGRFDPNAALNSETRHKAVEDIESAERVNTAETITRQTSGVSS